MHNTYLYCNDLNWIALDCIELNWTSSQFRALHKDLERTSTSTGTGTAPGLGQNQHQDWYRTSTRTETGPAPGLGQDQHQDWDTGNRTKPFPTHVVNLVITNEFSIDPTKSSLFSTNIKVCDFELVVNVCVWVVEGPLLCQWRGHSSQCLPLCL